MIQVKKVYMIIYLRKIKMVVRIVVKMVVRMVIRE